MSASAAPMPSIQGEAMELFTRVPPLPINSSRGGGSRGGQLENPAPSAASPTKRPSTGNNGGLMISRLGSADQERTKEGKADRATTSNGALVSRSHGGASRGGHDGGPEGGKRREDTNESKSKLFGEYLRNHLLANITSKDPAKDFVKRSFRHLHRGHGHVLTLDEFKEGLTNTFGALIPLQLIQATFDIFDTEPRTWQLDFDEFCHWLDTGERVLNSHGIMKHPTNPNAAAVKEEEAKAARKPRSNDTSGEFKHSVTDGKGKGMSMEQADRAQLKAHLMKHGSKLHKAHGLTEAQKSIVDHILMEKIIARSKPDGVATGRFDALAQFKAFTRGSESMTWPTFKKEVSKMLPHLHEESEIKEAFRRMDHNEDGEVDLKDFLMWQERMQEGKGNTDFWALQEEDHLEQIKLARNKASNLLVPDDYDGSTYHAKLSRETAQRKRTEEMNRAGGGSGSGKWAEKANKAIKSRDALAEGLRKNILSQVKGGSLEMLRAFRHFRPAAVGRRLFMDYREFRESIKQKGLGLSENDTRALFDYFDVDGSGEIDFSEFRRFLRGAAPQTGLAMGANRHQEKTMAAKSRVAALESATALDPSLAHGARSDQLFKAKVLRKIHGGQAEVLRALRGVGTDGEDGVSEMNYPCFASAIGKSGFDLSEPEIKKLFNEFSLTTASGEDENGVPNGVMSAQAFREWLLDSNTATSLDVGAAANVNAPMGMGGAALSEEQAAEQTLSVLHRALRTKVVNSFKSDHRNLLRAFRGVTRKKGSGITAVDFRNALSSFGLLEDKLTCDRLFKRYDWRQEGSISFQELMEIITSGSDFPPRRLTSSQRKSRLDKERRLPDDVMKRVEAIIRKALWAKHQDDVEGCFLALTNGGKGGLGIEGLKTAVSVGGVRGEASCEQALKQVLQRNGGATGLNGEVSGWTLQDFTTFFRPAECRAAIALARERDRGGQTEEDLKRAGLITEGNKARAKLVKQIQRLSHALKAADTGGPVRTGRVSRKTFAKALTREGVLGRVGDAELTRLLTRHGCSEQGGSYVNYPVFISSFTAAIREADPASAMAAVAASKAAASAAAAAAEAKKASRTFSGMASKQVPVKRNQDGGEPVRSKSNPQLALFTQKPRTAATPTANGRSSSPCNTSSGAKRELALGDHSGPSNNRPTQVIPGKSTPLAGRAKTADGSSRRRPAIAPEKKAPAPTHQGYFKRFTASGGDIDSSTLMKSSKSASALPDLVGQRPEVPKTTPIHRVMKKDVVKSAKELRKAFKECENPYRRGVVSVKQFEAVCQKNGVTVDREDVDFLLRLHRHQPSIGGKYAIPPKWAQAPPPAAPDSSGAPADTSKVGVRYDEFLRTCLSAAEAPMVAVN